REQKKRFVVSYGERGAGTPRAPPMRSRALRSHRREPSVASASKASGGFPRPAPRPRTLQSSVLRLVEQVSHAELELVAVGEARGAGFAGAFDGGKRGAPQQIVGDAVRERRLEHEFAAYVEQGEQLGLQPTVHVVGPQHEVEEFLELVLVLEVLGRGRQAVEA